MEILQDILIRELNSLPRAIGLKIVSEKLQKLGIYSEFRAEKVLSHVFDGDENVEWDEDEDPALDVTIDFDEADIKRCEEIFENFVAGLPDLIAEATRKAAPAMVRKYRRDWHAYRPSEYSEFELFKVRLQERWGKGLDALRMLLSTCRDHGAVFAEYHRTSRAKRGRHQRDALMALHMRGCQISAEIICLMENGYAEGAMARWRTLHEITIVALLIHEFGDKLAERYLSHRAVDRFREMKVFMEAGPLLGEQPLTKRDIAKITRGYDVALEQFGENFRHDHGWAANLIPGNSNPKFIHLEKLAGKATMRSYYKFASHNVHAGISGLAMRLSARYAPHSLISGASNTGFLEPGQNTAFTLTQLTSTLWQPPFTLDKLAVMQSLILLRNAVPPALRAAERKMNLEERAKMNKKSSRSTKRANDKSTIVRGC